ncbi:hypothetical protein F0562_030471 [Nyssa sinensis]|uniref:Uncharacterized protein n=1 Tax=Nyssa sinensis TaxID=561372 RepID=A0A5J5AYY0_9ASTE|nr:hypothetical protein F0562_030471 [Nyssa sinensis]
MDTYKLMGLMEILRNSFKIFFRNGKLMPSIASLSLLLNSLFFLSNFFFMKPLLSDLFFKETLLPSTSPSSPDFIKLLLGIKEANSLLGKNISLKDLLSGIARSWKRLFITSFYTALLGLGYTFFVLATLIPLLVIAADHPFAVKYIFIIFIILATLLYLYLSVVWFLALVISVTEENCYGIEALGKAVVLIKGHRLNGFALNFLSILLIFIVFPGVRMIKVGQSLALQVVTGLFSVNCIFLLSMFQFIAYTVLYFQCKKSHGEEIEMQVGMGYSKIPTKLAEDIP